MAVGDLFRIDFGLDNGAEKGSFGLACEQLDPDTDGDPAGRCAAAAATTFVPLYQALTSEQVQFNSVTARSVERATFNPGLTQLVGVNGVRSGASLPFISCMLVRLLQSIQGAKGNGRQFVPGIAEGDTVNGALNTAGLAAEITALTNALSSRFEDPDSVGFRPVVLRIIAPGPPIQPTIVGSPVTSSSVKTTIHRQRRRRRKTQGSGP